jgi:FkbM family methyltransferase
MSDLPDHSLEVPTAFGLMVMPDDDNIIVPTIRRTGLWAPQETLVLGGMIRPGDTFVDLGAHAGYMTVAGAHLTGPQGRVISFEPNPRTFPLLEANAQRLCHGQVRCVQAAAWSFAGPAQMSLGVVDGGNTGDNRAYVHPGSSPETLVDIQRVTLDEALADEARVDVIKMDVQGTEAQAVRGAVETLSRHRPLVLTEFWPQGTSEAGEDPRLVLEMYRSFGYEIRVLGVVAPRGALTNEQILALAAQSTDRDLELLLLPTD